MNERMMPEPEPDGFRKVRRKALSFSSTELVKLDMGEGSNLLLIVSPVVSNVDLVEWAGQNRDRIETCLLKHGAILFRGFDLRTSERFGAVVRSVSTEPLEYRERSSPRSLITSGIYTSTDHPADQPILFHNEQSYTRSWPMKLWFYCAQPAAEGGATPLADCRRVLERLDLQTRSRFLKKKVMYVRNYGDGFGLSWQAAFQTADRSEVERYCNEGGIEYEWKSGGRLRTRQVFESIVRHPKTGDGLWFEHVLFFHISSLEPGIRDALLKEFNEEDLPFNTYYGDGSPIDQPVLEEIRAAYNETAVRLSWRESDLLLIDNMLTSHGREPFAGPRKILVAMTELYARPAG